MNAVTDTIRTTRSPTAVAGGRTMKGMIQDVYAPPEGLSLREIAMPAVGPDDVLVRVHAAALNVSDCFGVRGARRFRCGWEPVSFVRSPACPVTTWRGRSTALAAA